MHSSLARAGWQVNVVTVGSEHLSGQARLCHPQQSDRGVMVNLCLSALQFRQLTVCTPHLMTDRGVNDSICTQFLQ